MKRTTLMLPESLRRRAMRYAVQQGVSLGELVRRSLEEALGSEKSLTENDSFLQDTVVWKKPSPKDLSIRHDDYLYTS